MYALELIFTVPISATRSILTTGEADITPQAQPSQTQEALVSDIKVAADSMRDQIGGNLDQIPQNIMDRAIIIPKGQSSKMDNVEKMIQNMEMSKMVPKIEGSQFILHKQDIRGDMSPTPKIELDDTHDMINDTSAMMVKEESFDSDDMLVNNSSDRWGIGDGVDDISNIGSVDSADATYIDVVGNGYADDVEIKIEPGQSLLKTSAMKTGIHQDDDL